MPHGLVKKPLFLSKGISLCSVCSILFFFSFFPKFICEKIWINFPLLVFCHKMLQFNWLFFFDLYHPCFVMHSYFKKKKPTLCESYYLSTSVCPFFIFTGPIFLKFLENCRTHLKIYLPPLCFSTWSPAALTFQESQVWFMTETFLVLKSGYWSLLSVFDLQAALANIFWMFLALNYTARSLVLLLTYLRYFGAGLAEYVNLRLITFLDILFCIANAS